MLNLIKQVFYGFPWRYFYARRNGSRRVMALRLAWAFTTLMIRLGPPPPGMFSDD